jgi:hypothetical protein
MPSRNIMRIYNRRLFTRFVFFLIVTMHLVIPSGNSHTMMGDLRYKHCNFMNGVQVYVPLLSVLRPITWAFIAHHHSSKNLRRHERRLPEIFFFPPILAPTSIHMESSDFTSAQKDTKPLCALFFKHPHIDHEMQ